jgi:anti-sigma regulatory factor (Ser/Thr protein kinase)
MAPSSHEAAGKHSSATPTLHLLADTKQIAIARSFVRETLGRWGLDIPAEEMEVVASELVTNAIVHGDGGVDVTVLRVPGRLRIEVVDEGFGPEPIQVRHPSTTGRGGLGLRIVEGMSDAWGADRRPGHTRVWMERRLPIDHRKPPCHP